MKTQGKTSPGMRLIAIALFMGLPVLLLAMAALNVVQLGDDGFAAAEKQAQTAALNRRLNAKTRAGKPIDFSPIYIAGASHSLASANLQQLVFDAVGAVSGRLIETVSVDPDTGAADTDDVRLKTTLDTDTAGLLQLLYRFESGLPLLDVENLAVRRLSNTGDDAASDMLRVDIALKGKWRRPDK